MTPASNRRRIRVLAVSLSVALVVGFAALLWQQHAAADRIVDAQRAGCLRTAQDRLALSRGIGALGETGLQAALEPGISGGLRHSRRETARQFRAVAADLLTRTRLSDEDRRAYCAANFPSPGIIP